MAERTPPQVHVQPLSDGTLPKPRSHGKKFYEKVREMRLDPTIAMARWLAVAPVLISNWSYEQQSHAPPGAKDLISEVFTPLRSHILETSFFGCIDFGWQAYEKVFEVRSDGFVGLKKLKPLLQDITEILVDVNDGSFLGVVQDHPVTGDEIQLAVEECLLTNFDVEGTNWYGEPIMRVVERAYDPWVVNEKGAARYDRKVAGSHWIIHYPRGTSTVGGQELDNYLVAQMLLAQLENSCGITVPKQVDKVIDDLNKDAPNAWEIELVNDPGGHVYYMDRAKYYDALKVRAMGLPERAVLEGQFGTKAEAESHGDFGITLMEHRHSKVVQNINWHAVNQVLRLNYGPEVENTVYVQQAMLNDTERGWLRKIYEKILENPDNFLNEMLSIDVEALKDRLGIPIRPEMNVDVGPSLIPEEIVPLDVDGTMQDALLPMMGEVA